MYGLDFKRYFWVILSALLQGLLLGQYIYTVSGPYMGMPLSLVIIAPFAFWLAQEHWGRRLRRFLGGLCALLLIFHCYWLWAALPLDSELYHLPTQNMNLARNCAAVFLFLPFFQCRIATWSWRVPYSDVFFQLCRNVFLLFQAVIVVVTFWALLLTASLLFDIIGLDFVPKIVFNPLVAMPLTSLTAALSITLALNHPGIDSLGRWILSILAWLLPPFSILSTVFVVALPFSGLATLWSTGQASSLMLLLQLATILLSNAAWLDGTHNPFYNRYVSVAAKLSLLCLPIYMTLCLYSLGVRVRQYGWSVDRIHAAFFVIVVGIWGLGYAGSVLLRQWPGALSRVNTTAAVILLTLVTAMNSPILDPYRLSANNQTDRLLSGQTHPDNFDFLYLRFSLGRYGSKAVTRLKSTNNEVISVHLAEALASDEKEYSLNMQNARMSEKRRRAILADARIDKTQPLSPRVIDSLVRQWYAPEFFPLHGIKQSSELSFVLKKITRQNNGNSGNELLLIKSGVILVLDISFGASSDVLALGVIYGINETPENAEDFQITEPIFNDIEIGGRRYQVLTQ
ncbi:hypothetical protein AGMMS50276_25590 [Synergistales bacterium]|nr:hypothetical protein AGMMS50276_25590 [Synergistales bacterium]